ncbi:MAG: MFS transporter, partial [Methanobrevibacter sp.]|nr:MFS transporter [Methanobrevibacter sp.]
MDMNSVNNGDMDKIDNIDLGEDILKKGSSKNLIIFLAAFTSFLSAFSTSAIAVALPAIATQFGVDAIFQNWLAMAFLLAIAVFSVPFGKLSSKFGLKKFFMLG